MKLTDSEGTILRIGKGIIDQEKVIYAPYTLICKGSEACLKHRKERREEISISHIGLVLKSVKIFSHAWVGRIVIHITHAHDLDARILLLHHHRMVVHDLTTTVTKLVTTFLSTCTRWKMSHINGKMLSVDQSMNHQDITGSEIITLLLALDPINRAAFKSERNRLAVKECEYFRFIKECHIHTTTVRTIIMHNLIVRFSNLRFHHKIFKNKTVLNLGNSKKSMPCAILFLHGPDYLGHILKLFLIFCLCPFVLAIRKKL